MADAPMRWEHLMHGFGQLIQTSDESGNPFFWRLPRKVDNCFRRSPFPQSFEEACDLQNHRFRHKSRKFRFQEIK